MKRPVNTDMPHLPLPCFVEDMVYSQMVSSTGLIVGASL